MNLIAGVDEVGTGTQLSDGWTFCVLEKTALNEIERKIAHCKVRYFHGVKFKEEEREDYRLFLVAAREQLAKSESSQLCFTLNEMAWKKEFAPFIQKLVSEGLSGAGILDRQCETILKRLFPPLATLQRLTRQIGTSRMLEIEMDDESSTRPLNTLKLAIQGHEVEASRILSRAYNAYRAMCFPGSPPLVPGGVRIVKDTKSLAVQIADVFGHFAQCHLYRILGDVRPRCAAKAAL